MIIYCFLWKNKYEVLPTLVILYFGWHNFGSKHGHSLLSDRFSGWLWIWICDEGVFIFVGVHVVAQLEKRWQVRIYWKKSFYIIPVISVAGKMLTNFIAISKIDVVDLIFCSQCCQLIGFDFVIFKARITSSCGVPIRGTFWFLISIMFLSYFNIFFLIYNNIMSSFHNTIGYFSNLKYTGWSSLIRWNFIVVNYASN